MTVILSYLLFSKWRHFEFGACKILKSAGEKMNLEGIKLGIGAAKQYGNTVL